MIVGSKDATMTPTLTDVIVDFLEYMEIEQNRSQNTIRNYDRYLQRLVEFADDIPLKDLNNEMIRKWRLWLNRLKDTQGEPLSKQTQNYHLIALRALLRYCAKQNIATIPADTIELAKAKRKQVTFLSPEELERLLKEIPLDSEQGLRDKAILELLYSGGLRVAELVSLNVDHINFKRREFTIRGKGQKDRLVFISDQAATALRNYLARRTDSLAPLFLSYSGGYSASTDGNFRRLTPRSIQRIVASYARKAGITKRVTPHTIRHSFATDLLTNGADLRSVQSLLGHSNVSTTQIYTHITDPQLKKIHEQFHRKKDQ